MQGWLGRASPPPAGEEALAGYRNRLRREAPAQLPSTLNRRHGGGRERIEVGGWPGRAGSSRPPISLSGPYGV